MERLSGRLLPSWLYVLQTSLAKQAPAALASLAVTLAYVAVWYLRQGYAGLVDDAQLYAFQAMAHLKPWLRSDLFLLYGSQDDYTIFPWLYAWFIEHLGLSTAAVSLTLIFKAWFGAAAWSIARRFSSQSIAWLCVGVMLVLPHRYGGLNVFVFNEGFLTARLGAESLALTSIALVLWNRPAWAVLAAAASMAFHPIMALPAILLWIYLAVDMVLRIRLIAAALVVTVVVFGAAILVPFPPLSAMDAEWLAIVEARSKFLFVQSWSVEDWDWMFLCLTTLVFAARVHTDARARNFLLAAGAIGAAGVALAALVSLTIPIELIIKGQPWRWMWISAFVATLFLASSIAQCLASRNRTSVAAAGILIAAWMLPSAWALPAFASTPLAILATLLYSHRERVPIRLARYAQVLAALATLLICASIVSSMFALAGLELDIGKGPAAVQRLRDWFALGIPAVAAVILIWAAASWTRTWIGVSVLLLVSATTLSFAMPASWREWTSSKYEEQRDRFADWRSVIGPNRTVLWTEDTLAVWFLLDRASFASSTQTAGVVFSREAALEAKRRAATLQPWAGHDLLTISTSLEHNLIPSLTLARLQAICSDESLGFVITNSKIAAPHMTLPPAKDWNQARLYDCSRLDD